MRKFAVFDIDGTLIRWQLYHAMADALAAKGFIDADEYQAMRHARMGWKKRSGTSFKDYEKLVIEIYEKILMTLSFEQLDAAVDAVFNEYKDQIYTYTRDLIAKLKKDSYMLFAISGSQSEIISRVSAHYGFDDFVATVYERKGAGFSGAKTIGSHDKDKALKELVAKHSLSYKGSVGVGDGRSDVAMLKLVERPIAFNPESSLFEYAEEQGWKIVIERKNMIYELESKDGKYQLVKTNS